MAGLVQAFKQRSDTSGRLPDMKGESHVVIAGTLTHSNVSNVLRELFDQNHDGDTNEVTHAGDLYSKK